MQNEEHCELLNLLVDEAGAHFETAGSLRGGRETFVTMKLPHTITLAGTDGLATTSSCTWPPCPRHDGTAAWRVIVTPVRIVCANTQRIALPRGQGHLRDPAHPHRHGRRSPKPARPSGIVWRYCEEFETAAQQLINQTLVLDEFQAIVDQLWPTDPTDTVGPRAAGIRDRRNTTLRTCSPTPTPSSAIRGTRWAGLQAITEYLDHHAPARTTTSAPPGCSPPTRSASASSAPTTCSPPADPGC